MSVKVNIQNIGPRWHTGPKEQKDYGVREPGPTNCPDNWMAGSVLRWTKFMGNTITIVLIVLLYEDVIKKAIEQ